jgi:uncharacterized membrane protein
MWTYFVGLVDRATVAMKKFRPFNIRILRVVIIASRLYFPQDPSRKVTSPQVWKDIVERELSGKKARENIMETGDIVTSALLYLHRDACH